MLLQGANSSELKVALKARMDALGEVLSEQERQQVRVREYVYVFWAGIISNNLFVRTGSCKPVITSMVVMPVVATAGQGDCLDRQTSKSKSIAGIILVIIPRHVVASTHRPRYWQSTSRSSPSTMLW